MHSEEKLFHRSPEEEESLRSLSFRGLAMETNLSDLYDTRYGEPRRKEGHSTEVGSTVISSESPKNSFYPST